MTEQLVIHVSTDWRRRPILLGKAGRVCAAEECSTILSRYNPRKMCSVHERKPLLDLPHLA
jgi:hypothetical protein